MPARAAALARHARPTLLPPRAQVDDLTDFSAGTMQKAVRESGCMLLFLSRGYFKSKNCAIEYSEALAEGKPLILVHAATRPMAVRRSTN